MKKFTITEARKQFALVLRKGGVITHWGKPIATVTPVKKEVGNDVDKKRA